MKIFISVQKGGKNAVVIVCLPPYTWPSASLDGPQASGHGLARFLFILNIEHYIGDACILSKSFILFIVQMYGVRLFGCTLKCIL